MAALVAIGALSVQLGLWASLGYVVADVVTGREIGDFTQLGGHPAVPDRFEAGLSAVVEYSLLLIATVGVPALVARGRLWLLSRGLSAASGPIGERLAFLAMTVFGHHLWLLVAPGAMRTSFSVEDVAFTTDAQALAGARYQVLVAVVAAVVLRWIVEARAAGVETVTALVETARGFSTHRPSHAHLRSMAMGRRLLGVMVGVVLLSATAGRWWHFLTTVLVVVVFVVLFVGLAGMEESFPVVMASVKNTAKSTAKSTASIPLGHASSLPLRWPTGSPAGLARSRSSAARR